MPIKQPHKNQDCKTFCGDETSADTFFFNSIHLNHRTRRRTVSPPRARSHDSVSFLRGGEPRYGTTDPRRRLSVRVVDGHLECRVVCVSSAMLSLRTKEVPLGGKNLSKKSSLSLDGAPHESRPEVTTPTQKKIRSRSRSDRRNCREKSDSARRRRSLTRATTPTRCIERRLRRRARAP